MPLLGSKYAAALVVGASALALSIGAASAAPLVK